jgi:glycosyltransferase involved in cell wall biosynthesis
MTTMRLGFDITPLLVPTGGIGTYVRNLLDHLPLVPATALEIIPVASHTTGRPSGRSMRCNKTVWMQIVLPRVASQQRLDLCHFTNNVSALWMPCPTVVTIHDMTLWLYPQHHYAKRLLAMRPIVPLAARRAAAIIAASESAKSDIVRLLGVPREKVHVIYEAAAPCFRPLPSDPARLAVLRRRYDLPDRYVLAVGTVEPRKNLVRLLEAFAQLVTRDPQPAGLVFVGGRGLWVDVDGRTTPSLPLWSA